jgi:hypothetical protein
MQKYQVSNGPCKRLIETVLAFPPFAKQLMSQNSNSKARIIMNIIRIFQTEKASLAFKSGQQACEKRRRIISWFSPTDKTAESNVRIHHTAYTNFTQIAMSNNTKYTRGKIMMKHFRVAVLRKYRSFGMATVRTSTQTILATSSERFYTAQSFETNEKP